MKIKATGQSSSTKMFDIIRENLLSEAGPDLDGLLMQAGVNLTADMLLADLKERISEQAEEAQRDLGYDEASFSPTVESEIEGVFYRFSGKGTVNWRRGMKSHDYDIPDDPDEMESWNVSGVLEIYVDDESIGQVNLNLSK